MRLLACHDSFMKSTCCRCRAERRIFEKAWLERGEHTKSVVSMSWEMGHGRHICCLFWKFLLLPHLVIYNAFSATTPSDCYLYIRSYLSSLPARPSLVYTCGQIQGLKHFNIMAAQLLLYLISAGSVNVKTCVQQYIPLFSPVYWHLALRGRVYWC